MRRPAPRHRPANRSNATSSDSSNGTTIVRLGFALLALALLAPVATAEPPRLDGFLVLRGASVPESTSWLDGGFGRFSLGSSSDEDEDLAATAQFQAAFDWEPSPHFRFYVQGLARDGTTETGGEELGLVEAWLESRIFLRTADELRFKLGQFFLATSRENVDVLWSSPYTLTWSAINSWIAEEVRPLGLSAEYASVLPRSLVLTVGGSTFASNDTQGVLLAWRGWSLGDRVSVWDEVVPLPPLDALEDGQIFSRQRDDGTKPFGRDLDDRLGWAGWIELERPESFALRWTHLENRADRRLWRAQYTWETRFDLLGAELHRGPWDLLAEWMTGETGMGLAIPPFSQLDFAAWYVLGSWSENGWRVSVRWDDFETRDRDRFPTAVRNDESGNAWTVATLWEASSALRFGGEVVFLDAERPEIALSGGAVDETELLAQLELRWFF